MIGETLAGVPAPDLDAIHQYDGWRFAEPAFCQVTIWKYPLATVVILTEHPENAGLSITNGAEYIAAEVIAEHELDTGVGVIIVVEHYPDSVRRRPYQGAREADTWDLVTFPTYTPELATIAGVRRWTLGAPDWHRITKAEVEAILIAGRVPA